MTYLIQDQDQRQQALEPQNSFIVQAPAGSGKTELLTQRFLLLLGLVNQPEEILAITFTKKAAAEMRARIINTLKTASTQPEPETPHAKKTYQLAKQALHRNALHNWNLLANPNRLRIQTIDSFNASLVKHLPLLSHFGAAPEITDNPFPLYREAVQEFLSHLEENVAWSDAIAKLLMHRDNDLPKIQKLLITMLAKRDQWLPYIMVDIEEHELRTLLQQHLAGIVEDILINLYENFPHAHASELLELAQFAAGNLNIDFDVEAFPSRELENKCHWDTLTNLVFTKELTWRKRLDKNCGFPAPSSSKNPAEKQTFQTMKKRMEALLETFQCDDKFYHALREFAQAPAHQYDEIQWEALHALYQVLKIVVAQLKVVFRHYGKIDYIENAQAALLALGPDEAPTDLALALDYRINHILIDEFQDTSNSQYRLIEKLISGWQPNDGRTLFVVGDPMQSIYRFREAEVGLFIKARRMGIGNVKLIPLTLAVNFRSTPAIVDWVNKHFQTILPPFEDMSTGAVAYSPSTANQSNQEEDSLVKIHLLKEAEHSAQAQAIIELIKTKHAQNPQEKIAILVRARTHLEYIIPTLKKANLKYRAIKIDSLDTRPVIQDLMALTTALMHPEDRVAWLAILRAPWCGLLFQDLLVIANHEGLIIDALTQNLNLSDDARLRLARILPVLTLKVSERQRYSLRQWVESTWLLLGGPACLDQSNDLDDVRAYLSLLENLDQGSQVSIEVLTESVSKLFAAPNNEADDTLQIMTIHNAKGLEFDTVILPYLERQPPNEKKQLLLWMEKSRPNAENALVLAPIHATGTATDSIYNFIKKQNATKTDHEIGRLLYVAATRAKKQLHLFSAPKYKESYTLDDNSTKFKSFLEKLWPAIENSIDWQDPNIESSNTHNTLYKPCYIKRLITTWINPVSQYAGDAIRKHQQLSGFLLPDLIQQKIGILIHRLLEQIGKRGIAWWEQLNLADYKKNLRIQFLQMGLAEHEILAANTKVLQALTNILNDARGRWILTNHREAKTEFAISTLVDNQIQNLVIDRTFIDESGIRWIIDYKTTEHDQPLNQPSYQEQLQRYARAFQGLENSPIKLGLYYPLTCTWLEVEMPEIAPVC